MCLACDKPPAVSPLYYTAMRALVLSVAQAIEGIKPESSLRGRRPGMMGTPPTGIDTGTDARIYLFVCVCVSEREREGARGTA